MLTTTTTRARAPLGIRHGRRWAAIVALLALLTAGSITLTAVHDDAGAMPEAAGCVLGGFGALGFVAGLVAFPPAGLFEVVLAGGGGSLAAIGVVDACGAWWTTDLADVMHVYGYGAGSGGGGGGGGGW